VSYDEYSNVAAPVTVEGRGDFAVAGGSAATDWIDGLVVDGAEVIATYRHPGFGRFPAVTTHEHGAGRITVAGTVPSPELSCSIARWAVRDAVADELVPDRELPVVVSSGTTSRGSRAWFLFNWGWDEQAVTLRIGTTDPTTGDSLEPGTTIQLPAWSTRILLHEPTDHHD
jgi:beta-galactosidase